MSKQHAAPPVQVTRLLGKFWTAANMLSLGRLFLVVPVTYLILTDGSLGWLFGLIILGMITDFFDGRVARWSQTVSEWGKVLDPLADKVAAVMVVMALVVRDAEPTLPFWLLALVLVRDGCIVLGGVVLARRTGQVVMSVWMGKVAVTALAVTVLAALLKADAPILAACVWVTAGLLVYSFALYFIRFTRMMRTGRLPADAQPSTPEPTGPAAER